MSLLRLAAASCAPASTTSAILEFVDLSVEPRARIAIIGPNGAGKSTLLAALAGRIPLLAGHREQANDCTVAFADRGPCPPEHTVELELLAHRATDRHVLNELRAAEAADDSSGTALAFAFSEWGDRGGWELEARMHRVLAGLELDVELGRALHELSGGQRQRVELAALLLADADVLLLDEPTDDLDESAVEWFERELLTTSAAVVIASHDRHLLERWPTEIVLLDAQAKRARIGAGPLRDFEERERARAAGELADYTAQERRYRAADRAAQDRAARAITMTRVDLNDGRHTKQEKAWYNERAGGLAASSRVLRDREERRRVERPHRPKQVAQIDIPAPPPRGSDAIVLVRDLVAGYDGVPVVGPIDVTVERGERLALVGANGAGKSTVLRTLTGELEPVAGSVRLGGSSSVAALAQRFPTELLGRTALEVIDHVVGQERRERAAHLLGRLLVRGRDLQRPVGELSEGSRRKVLLACVLASDADVILLDEPANHLDLQSRDALGAALASTSASIVFTSHDRALRELVATREVSL